MSISTANPYTSNEQLSSLEQDVLWEYAKLADKVKRISNLAKTTAETPNEALLAELRLLEKKMGLVLTLFKSSIWTVTQAEAAKAEEAERAEYEQRQREEEAREREQERDGEGEGYSERWDDSMED